MSVMMRQSGFAIRDERCAKLEELDRLLNDPEVPMEPSRVWALADEIAEAPGNL